MEKSGLTNKEVESIKSVFSKHPQKEAVLIYGLRARGHYKPASDIDITIKGENIDLTLLSEIECDLDDLLLPYKLDISIYDRISNSDLINHIDRVGVKLYEKTSIITEK